MDKIIKKPKVSVILPVYNGAKYIKKTIESVLEQTFIDFEFIIINDASTDETSTLIKSFIDSRIRYYENEHNQKLIKVLNFAIQISIGDYIARIDADDIMHKQRLSKQVLFLEQNLSYVLVASHVNLIRENTFTNEILGYSESHEDLQFEMAFYNPIVHPSVLIRKNKFTEPFLRYSFDFIHVEDYKLWTSLIQIGLFYTIPESLTYYRLHNEQISFINQEFQKSRMYSITFEYLKNVLSEYNDLEIEFLFFNKRLNSINKEIRLLEHFYLSKKMNGELKKRYLLRRFKKYVFSIKKITFYSILIFFNNKLFKESCFSIKQKLSLIFKLSIKNHADQNHI